MNERRILVVDDEAPIREIFLRALSQKGYLVQTAAEAVEAMQLMRASPAQVLFLDLNLPGMNGLSICAAKSGNPGPGRSSSPSPGTLRCLNWLTVEKPASKIIS